MNLRQVRKKIKSISNVKKITKAMELVSGIKMKKAQTLELEGRPYRDNLQRVIQKISTGIDPKMSLLLDAQKDKPVKKELCILVSSNKGLCGAFNVNLFRFVLKNIKYQNMEFITVGKKGAVFVGKLGRPIVADFSDGRAVEEISAIFNLALTKYLSGEYQKIVLIYNHFISTLQFEVRPTVLLPITLEKGVIVETEKEKKDTEYMIEPSPEEIIDYVLKSYVEDKIRGALISSEAVEHSARMIAMKNATDNADQVIYSFSLLGNKLRQEKITNELLDMVTAKESVGSN